MSFFREISSVGDIGVHTLGQLGKVAVYPLKHVIEPIGRGIVRVGRKTFLGAGKGAIEGALGGAITGGPEGAGAGAAGGAIVGGGKAFEEGIAEEFDRFKDNR